MSNKGAKRGLKFLLGLFVYSLTIFVVLAALTAWWGASQFQKPGLNTETTLFTVERGHGANTIATNLYKSSLIETPYLFIIGTTLLGNHTSLKAGEYEIPARASAKDIMHLLKNGKTFARRFTVREGLTSYETVRLLNGVQNLSGKIKDIPPEGSLLPNTYDYQLEELRSQALARMQSAMLSSIMELCTINSKATTPSFKGLLNEPCGNSPLKTVRDVLTLASIVEKETAVADERERVAGVFLNRLRKNMPLQTDPTVIYAITKGKHKNDGRGPLGRRLLSKDLKIDSPYNTYKYPGLPPGPIANPGRASIKAVLNPETHDYIYFVADGTGGHAFAKTLKEHNANVAKWRQIRRNQN